MVLSRWGNILKRDGTKRSAGETWRLLDTDAAPAGLTAALDEAIARALSAETVPNTLHFYRRRPPAVTLGYSLEAEANVEIGYCRSKGIDVIRRLSGGGAIYTDDRQLVYSLTTKGLLPTSVEDSLRMVCSAVVKGLGHLGLAASFSPVNDVLVKGKKVSGSAQLRKWGVVLQHGTVLVDADIGTMFRALKVPKHKLERHDIDEPSYRITTIRAELGRLPEMAEVKSALIKGFEEEFGIRFVSSKPTDSELGAAKELAMSRYGSDEWNLGRISRQAEDNNP